MKTTDELINLFLNIQCDNKATRNTYKAALNHFKSYMERNNLNFSTVLPMHIKSFEKEIKNNYEEATVYRDKNALRLILKFLAENEFIKRDWSSSIKLKPVTKKNEKFLTEKEVKSILDYLKSCKRQDGMKQFEFKKRRDELFFTLLIKDGFRHGEATLLRIKDFNFEKAEVYVRKEIRKNGKELVAFLDDDLISLIKSYLEVRNLCHPKNDYLFLSYRGNYFDNTSVNKMIKTRIKEANDYYTKLNKTDNIIRTDATAHTLRHTCSHLMDINGYSLAEIGNRLGQESIIVTAKYSHVDEMRLKNKKIRL